MAFAREVNLTKDSIQDFEIVFFIPGPGNTEGVQSGNLRAQVKLSDGSIVTREYDLLARLQDDAEGQASLANLADLRDYVRARLEAEVLP